MDSRARKTSTTATEPTTMHNMATQKTWLASSSYAPEQSEAHRHCEEQASSRLHGQGLKFLVAVGVASSFQQAEGFNRLPSSRRASIHARHGECGGVDQVALSLGVGRQGRQHVAYCRSTATACQLAKKLRLYPYVMRSALPPTSPPCRRAAPFDS